MGEVTASRWIDAPKDRVFDVIAHIEEYSKAVPHITNVEFLSEERRGAGTRFRETRVIKGREATTELEVTEYEKDARIRIVSDTHGTVWDSTFEVSEQNGGTLLGMTMEIKPHSLLARLTTPFISGMLTKALEEDLDAVKSYCES